MFKMWSDVSFPMAWCSKLLVTVRTSKRPNTCKRLKKKKKISLKLYFNQPRNVALEYWFLLWFGYFFFPSLMVFIVVKVFKTDPSNQIKSQLICWTANWLKQITWSKFAIKKLDDAKVKAIFKCFRSSPKNCTWQVKVFPKQTF